MCLRWVVVMLVNNGGHPVRKTVMPSRNNAGWCAISHVISVSAIWWSRARFQLTMVFMMFATFSILRTNVHRGLYCSTSFGGFFRPVLRVHALPLYWTMLTMRITMKDLFDSSAIQVLADDLLDRARQRDIPRHHDFNDWYLFAQEWRWRCQLRPDEFGHSGAGCGDCRPRAQRTANSTYYGVSTWYGIGP